MKRIQLYKLIAAALATCAFVSSLTAAAIAYAEATRSERIETMYVKDWLDMSVTKEHKPLCF